MNIFLYLEKDTFIHRLDPRAKVIALVLMSGLLLCFNHPLFVGTIFLFAVSTSLIAKVFPRLWQVRFPAIVLVAVTMLSWPFYLTGSTPLWTWGIIHLTRESLLYGIAMSFRWAGALIVGIVFLSTIRPDDFHAALVLVKIPYPIALVFSLAFRLVPTFVGVAKGIIEAQTSRGLDLRSGKLHERLQKYLAMGIPLFMHVVRQTNSLAIALESRGFAPGAKRTSYRIYTMKRVDYIVIISLAIILLICILLRLSGNGVILTNEL